MLLEALAHPTDVDHANIPALLATRPSALQHVQAYGVFEVFDETQLEAVEVLEEAFVHEGFTLSKLCATLSIHYHKLFGDKDK